MQFVIWWIHGSLNIEVMYRRKPSKTINEPTTLIQSDPVEEVPVVVSKITYIFAKFFG